MLPQHCTGSQHAPPQLTWPLGQQMPFEQTSIGVQQMPPQPTRPFGQQMPFEHVFPDWQHVEPHPVSPRGQHRPFEQIWFEVQQPDVPQPVCPAGQHTPLVQVVPGPQGGLQHVWTVVPLAEAGVHAVFEGLHGVPAGQHVIEAPWPQGVVFAGQPQTPRLRSMQGTPALQHAGPQEVVPAAQQQPVAGSEHVPLQHCVPQSD
jgi:hypothetical protein